jgi:hypothetical protein
MIEYIALLTIIALLFMTCALFNKLEALKLKQYLLQKDTISSDFLEFSSTNEIVKELEKRNNPPLLVVWIDAENNENKVNYFVFKKNLKSSFAVNILKKIIKDIKNSV